MDFYQLIGTFGMVLIVIAYGASQLGKSQVTDWAYLLLNFFGAVLLLISLCVHFNLGSFLIEIFWILISLGGMWRRLRMSRSV